MLQLPPSDESSSSSSPGASANSKWRIMTLYSCLALGLTQIFIEQWHPFMPIAVAIHKDESTDSTNSDLLDSTQQSESYIRYNKHENNDTDEAPHQSRLDYKETSTANDNQTKAFNSHFDSTEKSKETSADYNASLSSLEFIQEHFPECISDTGIIDLKTTGSYTPVLPGTQPRYNHDSCFVMKARYNCAHPPNYTEPEAFNYELVLNLGYANHTIPCRVRSLVDALGGPVALSQRPNNPTTAASHTRIAFHGSSYVRQMWEAMTCGFRHDITELMVKRPGPDTSLAAMERRNNLPIAFSEIGKPIRNTQWIQQGRCHGVNRDELPLYYHKDVTNTPNKTIDGCNDSIAMVQFQNSVEVYYVFRPNDFSPNALDQIYADYFQITRNFTTSDTIIDALVWNVGLEKPENILPVGVGTKREIAVDPWLPTLMAMQRRDLGVYFGADNPWITHPPDGHPCMPGIPDDEVNLILYMLYTGYTIN